MHHEIEVFNRPLLRLRVAVAVLVLVAHPAPGDEREEAQHRRAQSLLDVGPGANRAVREHREGRAEQPEDDASELRTGPDGSCGMQGIPESSW